MSALRWSTGSRWDTWEASEAEPAQLSSSPRLSIGRGLFSVFMLDRSAIEIKESVPLEALPYVECSLCRSGSHPVLASTIQAFGYIGADADGDEDISLHCFSLFSQQ